MALSFCEGRSCGESYLTRASCGCLGYAALPSPGLDAAPAQLAQSERQAGRFSTWRKSTSPVTVTCHEGNMVQKAATSPLGEDAEGAEAATLFSAGMGTTPFLVGCYRNRKESHNYGGPLQKKAHPFLHLYNHLGTSSKCGLGAAHAGVSHQIPPVFWDSL